MVENQCMLRPRAVALAVALALGLSGCGGGGGANIRPSTPPPANTTPPVSNPSPTDTTPPVSNLSPPDTTPPVTTPPDTTPPATNPPPAAKDVNVTVDGSETKIWSNDLSGAGGLIKDGTGTLLLRGNNTYTGGTIISDGTLQLGDGGMVGSIVGDVTDNGELIFHHGDDVTFDGMVSGSGSLVQFGGTLVLTGTNTYTGGTTIELGTLQIGDGGTTGAITGDVYTSGGGTLRFNRSDDVTFSGSIDGDGSLEQAGTGTLTLTGTNGHDGLVTISSGTLQLGDGGTTGSLGFLSGVAGFSDVTDNGTLAFNRSDDVDFYRNISGSGSLIKLGTGTLRLRGDNTYTGGTTISAGTLEIGGGLPDTDSIVSGNFVDNSVLIFNRLDDTAAYTGQFSGAGQLIQAGDGILTLEGNSSGFSGTTTVSHGTLAVGSPAGAGAELGGTVVVNAGATLGGYGSVGSVTSYGVLAPGSSTDFGTVGTFGTLTVNGKLTLANGSFVHLNLGAPGATPGEFGAGDNITVNGDLALDGASLKVSNLGDMGPGLYNLINYTGALSKSNGGLSIGTEVLPKQQLALQYTTGQVNLLRTPNPAVAFWAPNDPLSLGGSGTWTATSASWTNIDGSAPLGAMQVQPGFAEFQGTPGTVTVDDAAGGISVTGMQFFVDGYTLAGNTTTDAVTLVSNSTGHAPVINVGDGTAASAGDKAIVGVVLAGTDGLFKTDYGSLILTGANTYTGVTTIKGGALQLGNGGTTGSIIGDVVDNGLLAFDRSDDVIFSGSVSGTGSLLQAGSGTLTLTGTQTYTGGTTISGGTLQLGDGSVGSISGDVLNNGTLVFDNLAQSTFDGVVSGSGSLTKAGTGTLVLTGANTYTGVTTISGGTLQIGEHGATGSTIGTGNIVDNGVLVLKHPEGSVAYDGQISGTGKFVHDGWGTLTLDGDSSGFTGTTLSTNYSTLVVGSAAGVDAKLGGTVVVDSHATLGGYGSVGNVTSYGVLAPGSATDFGTAGTFGTLTVNGKLTLENGSFVHLNLGAPGATLGEFGTGDNIKVNGDVELNGAKLMVSNLGGTGPGLYNVINYTGALTQSQGGLSIGMAVPPKQEWTLQYTAGQVNLLRATNSAIEFWAPDGPLPLGGSGDWTATSATWTNVDGSDPLGPMQLQPSFAEFQGTPGTVTVDDTAGAISVTGMQFFVDGYTLAGKTATDAVTLVKNSSGYAPVINVGDGTAASANDKATIDAVLAGTEGLLKTGYGTLVLTGENTLSGVVDIHGGTLEIANGGLPNVRGVTVNNRAGMDATLQVDAGAVLDVPIELQFDATLKNSGVIYNPGDLYSDSLVSTIGIATIVNENGGRISNIEDTVLKLHGGVVINRGSGSTISMTSKHSSSGSSIIFYNSPGTLVNADGASISGPTRGVVMAAGGEVTNTGTGSTIATIQDPGDGAGIGVLVTGGLGTVTNSGGASISGSEVGVVIHGGGTLTNDGPGSSISGQILADWGLGVKMGAANSTVINTHGARISGSGGGIFLFRGGKVINGAGSVIESLSPKQKDCDSFHDCAIYVYAVDGYYGGPLTLSNAGSIVGHVQMDPNAANVVTLTAGGSIAGNLDIGTNAASTLTLNGAAGTSQLYSQAVTGTTTFAGSLIKDGAGTWMVDSDSLSTVSATRINGGVLQATNLLAGKVDVAAGGTLDGVPGVVGDLANAGMVAVHDQNSTVGGNYEQAATGTLAVKLDSKLDVTGTATLNGGTLEVTGVDSGYVSNTHTEVLTAGGGVSGAFDQLVKDSGVVFTSTTINYDANSVWLDTTGLNVTTAAQGDGVSYTPASMAGAVRVQGAFEQLDDKIATGTLSDVSDGFVRAAAAFQQAPNLRAAQASLESLSGQLHADSAAMTLQTIDATSRALSERLESASAQGDKPRQTWMRSITRGGGMARNGFADVGFQLNGWLVGSDTRLGPHSMAGFAFSQGQGMAQVSGRFDRNRSRNTAGMFYAGWSNQRWYAHGRVGMGRYHQNIERMLLLGSSYQGVWADYDGRYNVAYGESGLHFGLGSMQLTPFVDLEYDRVARNGFAEHGAGGFGLKTGSQVLSRWQSGVGLKLGREWHFGGGRSLGFDARAQWRQTLAASGVGFDASFVGLNDWRPLTGVGLSRRSAAFGFDLNAKPSANTLVKLGYEYLNGDRNRAGVASAHFSLTF